MHRGEIYEVNFPKGVGSEQHGKRYGVVVQSNELSILSTVVMVPTSTSVMEAPHRPTITIDGQETKVLTEQIRATAHEWIIKHVGMVSLDELTEIENALDDVLGLGRDQF